jgi:hypothetical protein
MPPRTSMLPACIVCRLSLSCPRFGTTGDKALPLGLPVRQLDSGDLARVVPMVSTPTPGTEELGNPTFEVPRIGLQLRPLGTCLGGIGGGGETIIRLEPMLVTPPQVVATVLSARSEAARLLVLRATCLPGERAEPSVGHDARGRCCRRGVRGNCAGTGSCPATQGPVQLLASGDPVLANCGGVFNTDHVEAGRELREGLLCSQRAKVCRPRSLLYEWQTTDGGEPAPCPKVSPRGASIEPFWRSTI